MAKNIVIADVEYQDVPSVDFLTPDGSTVKYIDEDESGGDIFKYGGKNAVKVGSKSYRFTLDDTSFVKGSSASTSATTIRAATTNYFTTPDSPTIAFGDKDIVVIQRVLVTPVYSSTATDKARQLNMAYTTMAYITKRKTTDGGNKTYRISNGLTSYIQRYYNSSGVLTRVSSNYGFYAGPAVPSVNSTTAASTYIKLNSPTLYYRVSSSYMSAANIKLVTECTWDWTIDIYTVDQNSSPAAAIQDELDSLLLEGIT